jgi:glutaredoxin
VACVVYSSAVCAKCDLLKRYLQEHNIEHTVRLVEEPEARVDALMLNIYSTPAIVLNAAVLHQSELFKEERLNEAVLLAFLGRQRHVEA